MDQAENQLLEITKAIEKQVDATIDQIDNLDVNDLEQLRKSRVKELKKQEEKRKDWLSNDHGKYEELPEEKMFFDTVKKSENCVVHFYTNTSQNCLIVDKHLKSLATKHIETRFVKINAEKCPFLAERLKIKTIPTLVLVHNGIVVDKVVGFTQLGNRDDFTTEMLEWRIAQNEIIQYEGDLSTPPDFKDCSTTKSYGKKIRDSNYDRDDDDLYINDVAQDSNTAQSNSLSTELTDEEKAELGIDD